MNFFNKFLRSRKQIIVYAIIKLILISYIVYEFAIIEELARRIIVLAFGFILLMSMVPVLLLHSLEMKKIEKENEAKNL